ncbi:DUF4097 family beta strand repeat-containing protein [Nonomuraea sp. NPDC049695]|uniref:DUF4097 family beta strand repeat-containing protein n=1 Tax=Nonomuraea sp. NPDC049695 TaxID=3154734 RepID=UPI00342DD552
MGIKRAGMIAGFLGFAALLTGCGLAGPLDEDTASYDVTDKVAGVRVEADSGTVKVVESDRTGIHVTERLSWRGTKPEPSHKVQGDTLTLAFKCAGTWGLGSAASACEVSYEVEVPKGLRVDVSSDSGDLTLRGLSGELKARSDSGDLTLEGLSGQLKARTDSGVIEADDLAAKHAEVETDSGDVDLTFDGQPDKVVTTSDSGSISIRVPQGPYNVVAKTDSGDKHITAANDPSAARQIQLTSDSGDLEVVTP